MSTTNIDPRWANIDYDRVNAEIRDIRDQIERLQTYINTAQPIQVNADGYVVADGDYFQIYGIKYAKVLFGQLAFAPVGTVLRIIARANNAVTVEKVNLQDSNGETNV